MKTAMAILFLSAALAGANVLTVCNLGFTGVVSDCDDGGTTIAVGTYKLTITEKVFTFVGLNYGDMDHESDWQLLIFQSGAHELVSVPQEPHYSVNGTEPYLLFCLGAMIPVVAFNLIRRKT